MRKTGGTSSPLLASEGYSSLFRNRFTAVKDDRMEAPGGRSTDQDTLPKQALGEEEEAER